MNRADCNNGEALIVGEACRACGRAGVHKKPSVEVCGEFERVRLNDVTVYHGVNMGLPLEVIIVELVRQKEEYVKQLIKLKEIAPVKYRLPDGRYLLWRCPDDLVPETKLDIPCS